MLPIRTRLPSGDASACQCLIDSMETPHACVRTRSELNKHIPVSCVPLKDLRTRSKIAAAKKADIHVLFGHLDTKVRPFALLKDLIGMERGFLRICDSSQRRP
jgi:hypothetical protein